jgi:hypothetical protein
MPAEPSTAERLAHRLLADARAAGDDAASAAIAAGDACERVSVEFSRWVGARGYYALLSRALAETRTAHPALRDVRYELRAERGLSGIPESVERYGAHATAQGLVVLLECVLALCVRLIGDDIVTTLVEKTMENRLRDDLRSSANLERRSARP